MDYKSTLHQLKIDKICRRPYAGTLILISTQTTVLMCWGSIFTWEGKWIYPTLMMKGEYVGNSLAWLWNYNLNYTHMRWDSTIKHHIQQMHVSVALCKFLIVIIIKKTCHAVNIFKTRATRGYCPLDLWYGASMTGVFFTQFLAMKESYTYSGSLESKWSNRILQS